MAKPLFETTVISNGGRDGKVLVKIIHFIKT